jgi:hypothetical protein
MNKRNLITLSSAFTLLAIAYKATRTTMESTVPKQPESQNKTHNVKPLHLCLQYWQLLALMVQDHKKFVIVLENDPNPKSTTYSVEFRVVSAIKQFAENDLGGKSFQHSRNEY